MLNFLAAFLGKRKHSKKKSCHCSKSQCSKSLKSLKPRGLHIENLEERQLFIDHPAVPR